MGQNFFGTEFMSFLEKICQYFKGTKCPFLGFCASLLEKSSDKKTQDPILEELIKMQKELIETKKEINQLKERVKTLEQDQGTLCEDVEHLYELI